MEKEKLYCVVSRESWRFRAGNCVSPKLDWRASGDKKAILAKYCVCFCFQLPYCTVHDRYSRLSMKIVNTYIHHTREIYTELVYCAKLNTSLVSFTATA